jgi:glycosyltransferase involved in cell wall biosynthesis
LIDIMKLSVIIPVLNEQDSLPILLDELLASLKQNDVEAFEIIFIDDGSTDQSWDRISEFASQYSQVSGIRFRRNFGKAAALTAGMQSASGDVILMMDADLQDDPAEISAFLSKIDEGFDVVNGWKQRRLDPWHKVYPSRVFNWMIGRLTGLKLHDHNCGLKMFRSEVAAEIRLYGEMHRFIPVLAFARGFNITELVVNHRARQHGHSKYGIRRFLRGFLDLLTVTFLTSFGRRPLHALGGVGIFFFSLGGLGLMFLALLWCRMNILPMIGLQVLSLKAEPIGSRPMLAYSIASLLLGGQALSLGLLAELIVASSERSDDTFSVRERTIA